MVDRIIFDLDDTLIDSGSRYRAQLRQFAENIKERLPVDRSLSEILEVQQKFDQEAVEQMGMDKERFPQSLVRTWNYFCNQTDHTVKESDIEDVRTIGWNVYKNVPEPVDGMNETLNSLGDKYQLVLYTMGDPDIQLRKIRHHDLEQWFREIHIVPLKDRGTLEPLVGLRPPDRVAIVGDSMTGEIKPGTELGLLTIHRTTDHQWHYHDAEVTREFYTIHELPETLEILNGR